MGAGSNYGSQGSGTGNQGLNNPSGSSQSYGAEQYPASSPMAPPPPPEPQSGGAMDQAREQGQQVMDTAREKGQQAAGAVEDRLNEGTNRAADAAQGLAGTLRERAETLPGDKPTELAYQAADTIERSAEYLRQTDVVGMRGDLEDLIRRYPAQSLAVGVALGFLVARAFR